MKANEIAIDFEAEGLELSGNIKKEHIVVMVGPSYIGKTSSLKMAQFAKTMDLSYGNHAYTKEAEKKELAEAKRYIRKEYLGLPTSRMEQLAVLEFTAKENLLTTCTFDPLEKNKGRKDPNALRHQFNLNGKKFQ
jgi:ABC-type lipoprotein export system ATPase subunit